MRTIGKAAAASLVAGVLVAGGLFVGQAVFASGGGPQTAAGAGATVSEEQSPGAQPGTTDRPRPFAGAYHSEATWLMVDGSTRSTVADRGKITAVGDASLTIEQPNGLSVTSTVTNSTCIRKDGQPAPLSDLQVGDRARIVQSNGSAIAVRSGRREVGEKGQGCHLLRGVVHGDIQVRYVDGSTRSFDYDRGKITSIGDGTIALIRRDGKSVTLRYDDRTRVVEEGKPGTVKDLKVGDIAMFFSHGSHADLIRCIKSPESES
jgi:uncharacterized protein DUF5666